MITIQQAIEIAKENEQLALEKIKIPEEQFYYFRSLRHPNLVYACENILTNKFDSAINIFYDLALIYTFLHSKYDNGNYTSDNIFTTHLGFNYVVISDSSKLITHYLKYRDDFLDTFGSSFAKAIQASLKNDNAELENQLSNLEKHTGPKSVAKNYSGVTVAFRGILNNDQYLAEKGINEILAKHGKQEQPPVVKDYINIEALTMAKLAYRKGLIIDIENSLLPRELIPVKELNEYKIYEFLKDMEREL